MTIKVHVEHLVSSLSTTHPIERPTAEWVAALEDRVAEKLAAVGLIPPRESSCLGPWLDKYIASRTDLKPSSRVKLEQTKTKLLACFDRDLPLRKITPDMAADWRQTLIESKLDVKAPNDTTKTMSTATVKTHIGNAKTIFNAAVDRELIARSPFEKLRGGATASANVRYVRPDETAALLQAAPLPYRVLLGLARLAGLRAPSETHLLTWGDVDWQRGRLTVRSPKTEHHAGKEQRTVPITPPLATILQDAFDAAREGENRIVTLGRGGNVRRVVKLIVAKAGVPMWDDIWQTLRRSCEMEWALTFPQYVVSNWIGHSITVSGKHYANSVPDEIFDRAAHMDDDEEVAQNPAQSAAEIVGNVRDGDSAKQPALASCSGKQDDSEHDEMSERVSEGIRTRRLSQNRRRKRWLLR